MALKGTLQDFSVADIFQLIGQQSKSGSLMVKTGEKEAQVVFDNGKVILGTFRKSDDDFLLGTMLLRAGVITSDQLNEAMNQQKSSLRSLGDVLRSMGAITPAILGEFVSLQLKEVLFRLFQWKQGLYEFVPGEIKYNRNIIHPQSAEGVLMDGFRMLDEWPGIISKVENLDMVYQAKVDPTQVATKSEDEAFEDSFDDAFSDFDEPAPEKNATPGEGVSDTEKKILSLLDGHHSVQEVIYLSRLGTFETTKLVSDLLSRDLIEKVDELSQTRVASGNLTEKNITFGKWILAHARPMIATLFFSLLFPLLAFNSSSFFGAQFKDTDKRTIHNQTLSIEDLKTIREYQRLVQAISLYRFTHLELPYSLEDLGFSRIHAHWIYHREQEHFQLKLEKK